MTDDNLRHWAPLSKTDPKFTKAFTRSGGFRGTDINPTWRIMRMTETFGPVGIGWGMTKPEYQTHIAGDEIAVYCTIGIWFREGDAKSEPVYGVGGDIIAKRGGDGKLRLDDEAYKKAYTDALGNAMKSLGVSADVFLKLFDDSKYRDEVGGEYREKERDTKPAANRSPSKSEPAPPPPANSTAKVITLETGDGNVETFNATKGGAVKFLDRLEELVMQDHWYWKANEATATRIAKVMPDLGAQIERIATCNVRAAG